MKKGILLVILLFSFQLSSQEYRKYWKDGKLSWNDFQNTKKTSRSTKLQYIMSYQYDKKDINNINYIGLFANAYMDKTLSYAHDDLKNQHYLDYNQVVFNLIEKYRRILQQELFQLKNSYDANQILEDIQRHLTQEVDVFKDESNLGEHDNIIKKWLQKTNKELAIKPTIPKFNYSNWGFGIYFGLDFGMHTQQYKQLLNNTVGLTFGLETSYKKVTLSFNGSITNSKLKRVFNDDFNAPIGDKVTLALLNVTLGYPIYDTKKTRVTPFIGYGLTEFAEIKKDNKKSAVATGLHFGINTDLKLKKTIEFTPDVFNLKGVSYFYVRTHLSVAKSNFNLNAKGYFINFGIAVGIDGLFIK